MPFEFLNALKKDFKNMDLDVDYDYEEENTELLDENEKKDALTKEALKELLNFYNNMNKLRDEEKVNIISMFKSSYDLAPYESIILLFYLRDKDRGLGERRVFNIILNYLGNNNCEFIRRNIFQIPKYGRYDDLYALFNTPLEVDAIDFIKVQLDKDINSDTPSTLAKWLKSENTSSKESRELGRKTRQLLDLTPKEYRQKLSTIRNRLGLIEHNISNKEYKNLEYGSIPKRALYKYNKAFERHDGVRFKEFREFMKTVNKENSMVIKSKALTSGLKLNEVVFPYDVMEGISKCYEDYTNDIYCNLWNSIPDYYSESKGDIMVTLGYSNIDGVDFEQRDIYKGGIGATLYIRDNNKGIYKNHIITMKDTVNFKRIKGENLKERIIEISETSACTKINVEGALDLILLAAIKNGLSNNDIPNRLLFILDENCEVSLFKSITSDKISIIDNFDMLDKIKLKWSLSELVLPSLTFWFIESKDLNKYEVFNDGYVKIIKGYSNEIFLNILEDNFEKSTETIESIINSPRYESLI